MTDDLVPVEELPLWVNAPMRCVVCGWEWTAAYCMLVCDPQWAGSYVMQTSGLECRECGHMNEAPLLPKEN